MADDNQDQEVENILSSIKDILEADDGDNKVEPLSTAVNEEKNVLDEVLSEDVGDDVLELSQDMRIDVANPAEENLGLNAEPIAENIEAEPAVVENIVEQTEQSEEPMVMPEVTEAVEAAPAINEIQEEIAPEPMAENTENTTVEVAEETVAEEIPEMPEPMVEDLSIVEEVSQDEPAIEENSTFETENTVEPAQEEIAPAEMVVEETPVIEQIEETSAVEQIEETPVEEVVEQEATVEVPEAPMAVIQEVEEPKAEVEPMSDPVDASANIISNFAKMFAKGKQEPEPDTKEPITAMGNGAHTLEDFVKEAIVKVIGDEIVKKWNNGAEYQAMAEAEIKNQVQTWVNANLPAMVEKIVKEEMERVIAKVGSQG